MFEENCLRFRKCVISNSPFSQEPRGMEKASSLIAESRGYCDGCRRFLSAELAIDETLLHILPRGNREKRCPDNAAFVVIFRLAFEVAQWEEDKYPEITISGEDLHILNSWMSHEKICADCRTYFRNAVEVADGRERAYRRQICEKTVSFGHLSPVASAYVI